MATDIKEQVDYDALIAEMNAEACFTQRYERAVIVFSNERELAYDSKPSPEARDDGVITGSVHLQDSGWVRGDQDGTYTLWPPHLVRSVQVTGYRESEPHVWQRLTSKVDERLTMAVACRSNDHHRAYGGRRERIPLHRWQELHNRVETVVGFDPDEIPF